MTRFTAPGARTRRQGEVNEMVDDLVSDMALTSGDGDRLDHEAIVKVAADMVLATEAPVNIALFGSWGSGKSSFLASLRASLEGRSPSVRVVRYDAWKYGGRALKLNFIESVADDLGIKTEDFGTGLRMDQETIRVKLGRYLRTNWKALALGLIVAAVIATLWFFATSIAAFLVSRERGFGAAMDITVSGLGSVLSLALIALLVGPRMLDSAVVKVTDPAPQTDDQFASRFKKLVGKATDKGKKKLVVFVDELDRCSPKDVVATLVDLKTFLEVPGCVFVVAADREVLESALQQVPQSTPIRESDPYYSTPGAFLDKIFQHQLSLPPLRPQTLTKFARDLVTGQGGVWAELRAAQPDNKLFLEVVYLLVPVHVRSPRRVKVLLNHYATTVRTAQSRGLDWLPRASEIAMYTVLQVEFPRLAADLATAPMLLAHLRGAPVPAGAERLAHLVNQYVSAETAEPAGPMLDSENDEDGSAKEANRVLNAQLRSYLAKAAAQGIDDPRPDLFYMQSAGFEHGITDPEVGHVIDVAADLSPDEVLEALDGQPASVLTTAAHLLAQQAEDELGPGRTTIVESLCRLLEKLDHDDLRKVAELVEPIVWSVTREGGLRDGAIPGAFTLGVVTGRTDLVDELVARYSADEFAEKGLLTRLGPVLGSGDELQVETVRRLLLESYQNHPEPMHDLLRTLPLDTARNLWALSRDRIDELLSEMASDSASRAATTTKTTSAAAVEKPDAAGRWRDLLDAVLGRADNAGLLISGVLMLGQLSDVPAVQAAVLDREDDALEHITDAHKRTEHALVALAHAPIANCGWWADLVTADAADETLARRAVVRLFAGLPGASSSVASRIEKAVRASLGYLDETGMETAADSFVSAAAALEWTVDADEKAQRTALYGIAQDLLASSQAKRVREAVVDDLVGAFESYFAPETVADVLARVRQLDRDTAADVDAAFEERDAALAELVASVRVRLTARNVASMPALPLDLMLEVAPLAESKDNLVSDWVKLQPSVEDYIRVQPLRAAATDVLGTYAGRLTVEDRTTLWLATASRGVTYLTAIGKHGLTATAFTTITDLLTRATAQQERTSLAERALTARPANAAAGRALADLALALLGTDVRGDGPLAAKLALQLGDTSHGRLAALRTAFDTEVARSNHKLTQKQITELRDNKLLSKKKDIVSRAVDSVRGRKGKH
ncbi:P-loop NTPase fold protein [Cellulomonas taurus]|uniref:P-loop NTPase fold protein n=1 Tax=Cellulomonas taurus TaxID=2729175 RepID=UPI00145F5361|nr:P-loop NTPase fold protein [Cellulomonas taurus]